MFFAHAYIRGLVLVLAAVAVMSKADGRGLSSSGTLCYWKS
jgi:hypothetical protein